METLFHYKESILTRLNDTEPAGNFEESTEWIAQVRTIIKALTPSHFYKLSRHLIALACSPAPEGHDHWTLLSRQGRPLRRDYEYRREGTRNLFLTWEPLAG